MFRPFHSVFRIDPREVEIARRGFTCTRLLVKSRLERIGKTFLHGYHTALDERDQDVLARALSAIEPEFQGFAFEGAAMAMTLLDEFSPWKRRFERFVAGPGKNHIYMVHVGAGWAWARIPWQRRHIEAAMTRLHPVLRWLVMDGYGFHEGYFHWQSRLESHANVIYLSEAARHVYFQGLGRSLWFIKGADPLAISQAISKFPRVYRGDAWSGVGLACAYAGGASESEIAELRRLAGPHIAETAQGAAFASKARALAGNLVHHTEIACRVLCGISATGAAALCDESLNQTNGPSSSRYQQWRGLLQERLSSCQENLTRGESYEPEVQLASTKPQ